MGFEPTTPRTTTWCSTLELRPPPNKVMVRERPSLRSSHTVIRRLGFQLNYYRLGAAGMQGQGVAHWLTPYRPEHHLQNVVSLAHLGNPGLAQKTMDYTYNTVRKWPQVGPDGRCEWEGAETGAVLKAMARLAGFEPATYGLEVRCSIQLSYRRVVSIEN